MLSPGCADSLVCLALPPACRPLKPCALQERQDWKPAGARSLPPKGSGSLCLCSRGLGGTLGPSSVKEKGAASAARVPPRPEMRTLDPTGFSKGTQPDPHSARSQTARKPPPGSRTRTQSREQRLHSAVGKVRWKLPNKLPVSLSHCLWGEIKMLDVHSGRSPSTQV